MRKSWTCSSGIWVRRVSMKLAAGILILIGAGFLLAALWTWLADGLDWGPLYASLALGAVFVLIGLVLIVATGSARHKPPTSDELRADIEERVSLATGVVMDRVTTGAEDAIGRVQQKAGQLADAAGNRVQRLVDSVSYGADRFVGSAEARVVGAARRAGDEVSQKLGIGDDQKERIAQGFEKGFEKAKSSNAAALAPVIGAFAVGLTLAQKFVARRRDDGDLYDDDDDYYDDDDDWYDDDRRY
ncbi:phage holin family protein [Paracoccus sp. DMF-8]|uniref:phage holin family protein n=1 Tax=Paracoccus sp. DMF-8 TaxID=3019445 RepID=UPI0023E43EF9|nr:phage holin family protein [Paracoccus sp. DMF-8]MDF3608475.1 phage holin family protein [Paracoccus sp. DMF-8]